jgi:hypothetical protein
LSHALMEALQVTLTLKPTDDDQRAAQREMVNALEKAMEARRQRAVISQSPVNSVKWAAILLQGLVTLIAIAMVHSDNRLACATALTMFATGIAASVLLIADIHSPLYRRDLCRTGSLTADPSSNWNERSVRVLATLLMAATMQSNEDLMSLGDTLCHFAAVHQKR